MKKLLFTAFAALFALSACHKYEDESWKNSVEERLTTLESAVETLDAKIKAGALIKSVTPIAGVPGGWRIEFTGGSPSSVDIMNGAAGVTPATPRIEVRTNPDGSISVWYKTDGDWTDTGVNIKGPQGPTGPAGVSPRVRTVDNGDGTISIQYNTTAGYPDSGWAAAGSPIALDSNPDDRTAILSIVDNGPAGTITITMNDSDVAAERTTFEFAKASGAARFEIVGFNDKVTIREGLTAQIRFVVNPSDAYVPTGEGTAIAGKWQLNQTGTRASYVTAPTDFALASVLPDEGKPGQYVATIECLVHNAAITDYAMALVLDTGTAAAPSLVCSPTFVLGTETPVASGRATTSHGPCTPTAR